MTAVSTPNIRTRSDLLALGSGHRPWAFLALAIPTLRQHPDDHDLRVLIAANACAVGLPTLARDLLRDLPQSLQTDPNVGQLVMMIESLPHDRLDTELLSTRVSQIADSMRARGVCVPDGVLETTLRGLRRTTVLRASDGNIVRRDAGDGHWTGLGDHRATIRNAALPHLRPDASPDPARMPRGIVLDGADPAWLLERLASTLPVQPDGFQTPIIVVHPETPTLLLALALLDDGTILAADPRIAFITGPDCIERFRTFLSTRIDYALPDTMLRSGQPTPGIEQALHDAQQMQQREHQRLAAATDEAYRTLDRAHWAARFTAARTGQTTLRIVLPVSRYSTFVHHAAEDLRDALQALGHEIRILDEPDHYTRLASPAYLRLFAEWRPDLVISINHPRRQFGQVCPANLPVLTWVQDQMQHLYDRELGKSQGPLDFLAGVVNPALFSDFGFPRQQAMPIPVVASSRKFHDGPIRPADRDRFACDIAYVSHNSQPPAAMHDALLRSLPPDSPLHASMRDLPERITDLISAGLHTNLSNELTLLAGDVFARASVTPDPRAVSTMLHQWILPLAERTLRHETLEWAAALCTQRGWSLRIYGSGWESHPTLSNYAGGRIDHGEALRACYQSARIHLHASPVATVHQRIIECALSGGFPACRITGSDISILDTLASARLAQTPPEACYPPTRQEVAFTSNHAHLCMLTAQRQRLGLPAWQWHCLMPEFRDPDRPYFISEEFSPAWLLGDLSEMTCWDRPSFERLIDRTMTDDHFRASTTAHIRARIHERLTHDALAQRSIAFLADRLRA